MKLSINRQQTCIWSWLLATLVIGGVNAHKYMEMQTRPMAGYSQVVKVLQVNLQQFDKTLSSGLFSLAKGVVAPVNKKESRQTERVSKKQSTVAPLEGIHLPPAIELPSLSGIMRSVNNGGKIYYQAVINGRVCRAKDKIDDFQVMKINSAGVVLGRADRKWTIENPAPDYSSDQGN